MPLALHSASLGSDLHCRLSPGNPKSRLKRSQASSALQHLADAKVNCLCLWRSTPSVQAPSVPQRFKAVRVHSQKGARHEEP